MRKNPVDPDLSGRSDRASRLPRGEARRLGLRARFTPVRLLVGGLALALLSISVVSSVIVTTRSYASTNQSAGVLDACATATATSAPTNAAPGGGTTSTPIPRKTVTSTPTAAPTATATDTPSPTATTPIVTPTTPTTTPSASVSPSPSSTVDTSAVSLLSFKVSCSPTVTATVSTQTPDTGATPINPTTPTGNTTNASQPPHTGSDGGGSSSAIIVGGVLVVLVLGLGLGWFFFRRMLLPQGVSNSNLPPSGARPWSRTRAPNPDSLSGLAAVQGVSVGPGGPTIPGGANPTMFAGSLPGTPANNGYNGPGPANFAQPTMNGSGNGAGPANFAQSAMPGPGNGPSNYSDGFIPPSPQIFAQSDQSMIPPGSGAFPVITNTNGFTPASPAFNAMYGLPDDPFSASQAGAPGWMSNLGNTSSGPGKPGFGGPPQQRGNLPPGEVDINDPKIDEIIRQYSQKSQSTPQQQMSPVPPSPRQQMSPVPPSPQQQMPSGPPLPRQQMSPVPPSPQQQMSPARPPLQQQMSPAPQQRMPPVRPPVNGISSKAALPLSPPPPMPQREPRPPGKQDSHWLQ